MKEKKRIGWIDFIKGIAIIAVVIDHNFGITYQSKYIQLLASFSVTLFILIAGYTSYFSLSKRMIDKYDYKYIWNRVKRILIPYCKATIVYTVILNDFFDLRTLIVNLLNFKTVSVFYFVVFFIQLIVVSPLIYVFILKTKNSLFKQLLFLVIVWFISIINIKYTFVLDVWGGGKYVLGGTYLFVFTLGMLLYCNSEKIFKNKFLLFIGSLMMLIIYVNPQKYVYMLGKNVNPPGISLIVYGLTLFVFLYAVYNILYKTKIMGIKLIIKSVSICGKYSIYIFLYHMLFQKCISDFFSKYNIRMGEWSSSILLVSLCIILPIMFVNIERRFLKHMRNMFRLS